MKVLILFGTRPEAIKLAPVIRELRCQKRKFDVLTVCSGQHRDLIQPFVELFGIHVDHDLAVMTEGQTLNGVCCRVLSSLDPVLSRERPDCLLVQGDTTTALAGALAGFQSGVPIGHVEAGLRSGDRTNPYPEEMNRMLITRLASLHFAATPHNRETLLAEGVNAGSIFVTGNPVTDALNAILKDATPSEGLHSLLVETRGLKRVVLTTHRRESFGTVMAANLLELRRFAERHGDIVVVFPVHPNPKVREVAQRCFDGVKGVRLVEPMGYEDFVVLLSSAWLIVSDSGGIQEEAPTLRKPLLVLRRNTERPEAIDSGVVKLVGGSPERLGRLLEECYSDDSWVSSVAGAQNPFGRGNSARLICAGLESWLTGRETTC